MIKADVTWYIQKPNGEVIEHGATRLTEAELILREFVWDRSRYSDVDPTVAVAPAVGFRRDSSNHIEVASYDDDRFLLRLVQTSTKRYFLFGRETTHRHQAVVDDLQDAERAVGMFFREEDEALRTFVRNRPDK